jgi:hypothetical protein
MGARLFLGRSRYEMMQFPVDLVEFATLAFQQRLSFLACAFLSLQSPGQQFSITHRLTASDEREASRCPWHTGEILPMHVDRLIEMRDAPQEQSFGEISEGTHRLVRQR